MITRRHRQPPPATPRRRLARLGAGLTLVALWAAAGGVAAAEEGFTLVATDLKAERFLDARAVTRVAERTRVEILERQAGWVRVRVQGREGWLRLLSVRLGSLTAQAPGQGSWLSRFGLGGGRSGGGSTITTGIRGFTAFDLENAVPDPEQVRRLRQGMVTPEQAQRRASESGLSPYQVTAVDAEGRPVEVKP